MNKIPKEKGSYLLFLKNHQKQNITIGSLGEINFQAGYYVYVGSALGPGGLEKRVKRHLRFQKKIFWHIDYLLNKVELVAIATIPLKKRLECKISQQINSQLKKPDQFLISDFGSSDCSCKSHLFCLGDSSLAKIKEGFIQTIVNQMSLKLSWITKRNGKK